MQIICILLVAMGAGVMLYSIYKYYKSLDDLKLQMGADRLFGDWIYAACFLMMIFFFIGYIIFLFDFILSNSVTADDMLISLIFFFGAVFVFAMGTMMRRMFTTLKENMDLRVAKEMAEESGRAKSIFFANVSHEIRTPMNSILGFAELSLDDDLSPKIREYLNRILENANLLLQIINDILDASKIESGKIALECVPFDLHSVLLRCQAFMLPTALKKGLELQVITLPITGKQLMGDPLRLNQALMNLLSNAIKFTEKGTITLTSTIVETEGDSIKIRIDVEDSGIGMSREQLQNIFEPFTQADSSTTRNYGGSGLGLSITKNIIEMMGGGLFVKSEPGGGSVFSFELPFKTIDENAVQYNGPREQSVSKRPRFDACALVCDDNYMNQQLIGDHLSRVGIAADIADNGKIGLDYVISRIEKKQKPYDIIFMDMFMPVMDGIEAASKISALGAGSPIVAMTANEMPADMEEYRKNGICGWMGKPFTTPELWGCLTQYLEPAGGPAQVETEPDEDDALTKKMKATFVKNNRRRYKDITEAISAGDFTLAHRIAHTLKGNAGLIGKIKLQYACALIETLLGEGAIPSPDQMATVEEELNAILEELDSEYGARDAPAAPEDMADVGQALELFARLAPMLEDINPECVDMLDEIKSVPGAEGLARQIENYDFDGALLTVAELKKGWA